jgi:L-seryl-tRNA(Ser) seleniumtransferase
VVLALRHAVGVARDRIGAGGWEEDAADVKPYLREARSWLVEDARPSLRPVVNATGVVLHTNLGRAPLAAEALAAIRRVSSG